MENIYNTSPTYETDHLTLREVSPDDAADLLICYSDPEAVARMNSDNCVGSFLMKTEDNAREAIHFWLKERDEGLYMRLAIIPKALGKAVGTVEIFDEEFENVGRAALLRIDLASEYENEETLSEIIALAIGSWMSDFSVKALLVKALNVPKRALIFSDFGFVETNAFRPGFGYMICHKKDIAYCGLACMVCSESFGCVGCKEGGCDIHGWCKNYKCCKEKGIDSCGDCQEFPCSDSMTAKMRPRAFLRFAKEQGTDKLIKALMTNKARGIVYHYKGELIGDYDKCASEEEIIALLESALK